ncbi:MAG: hypothetical protein MN733_19170 [Nitrososphaera sp.]|nr:hypothetical protein [Nitrososphaera sp.]
MAEVETAVKDEGAGAATIKTLRTWIDVTKQICHDAITRPIIEKYTGETGTQMSKAELQAAAKKEALKTEIAFEVDGSGNALIKVAGNQVSKKKLW